MARTVQKIAAAVLAAVVGFGLGCASAFAGVFVLERLSRVLGAPVVGALLVLALIAVVCRCGARLLEK